MTFDGPTQAYRIVRGKSPRRRRRKKQRMPDWLKRLLFYVPMFLLALVVTTPLIILFAFDPDGQTRANYALTIFGFLVGWMGLVAIFEWKCFPDD